MRTSQGTPGGFGDAHEYARDLTLLIHPNSVIARAGRDFCRAGASQRARRRMATRQLTFDFDWLEVSTKGSMRRQRRDGYGPAAQNRPASARKTARSGHAVGK